MMETPARVIRYRHDRFHSEPRSTSSITAEFRRDQRQEISTVLAINGHTVAHHLTIRSLLNQMTKAISNRNSANAAIRKKAELVFPERHKGIGNSNV